MPKSTRQCLEETLEDLTEDELRKFKANLHEFPVKQGYDNIPRGRLQKADALDLSDLLLAFYTDYAVEVTAAVLRRSQCQPQAENLVALFGIGNDGGMEEGEFGGDRSASLDPDRQGGQLFRIGSRGVICRILPRGHSCCKPKSQVFRNHPLKTFSGKTYSKMKQENLLIYQAYFSFGA